MDPMQQKWQFDWKPVGDYLLGRSTLIGIASMMLLTISAYATWHGMRDFIMGVSGNTPDSLGPSIPTDLLVIMVVVALTFLMWLALRETFGSHRRLTERLITIPL
jgi:ABC-type anion transport system duplicated permease subunit